MSRLTPLVAAVAVAASTSAAALAQQAPAPRPQPHIARVAYICVNDEATRRAFERQYGQAPIFVTAEQAAAANVAGERWTTPRCMTDIQHARWERMRRQTASRD